MKNIIIIVVIVLVLGVGAFVYFNKHGNNNMQMPAQGGSQMNEPIAPGNIVIKNYTFMPSTLTVKVGDTVTWTNNDSVAHSIKSVTFNSSTLNTGDTFKFTFNTPGTYNYNCGIHPTMTGTVIVQ